MSTENTLKGIQLVSESSVDPNKRVICLKREAIDNITKRLKILEEQKLPVVYHNSNKCYKRYRHNKAHDNISSKHEARDDSENIESDHDSGGEQVISSADSSRCCQVDIMCGHSTACSSYLRY